MEESTTVLETPSRQDAFVQAARHRHVSAGSSFNKEQRPVGCRNSSRRSTINLDTQHMVETDSLDPGYICTAEVRDISGFNAMSNEHSGRRFGRHRFCSNSQSS
jgi:hypothetical protein